MIALPTTRRLAPLLLLAVPLALAAGTRPARGPATGATGAAGELASAVATITESEVETHLLHLAAPELEGRDSPSVGLARAAEYLARHLEQAGLRGAGPEGSFLLPFQRELPAPVPERCRLSIEEQGAEPVALELGKDFVPLPGCAGAAEGKAIFVGFGISARSERYDDLKGADVEGRVAVILEGEPRHPRLFEGDEEVTEFADVYGKLETLAAEGAVGVLVVRREVEREGPAPAGLPAPALGFRHTWATWNLRTTPPLPRRARGVGVPVHEVTAEVASRIVGEDVLELARRIDRGGKPLRVERDATWISLQGEVAARSLAIDNVVGILEGSDPELAGEYVVIGAHYDHIGVDPLGRIGCGADDNASGTAVVLEVVQALALARPRRSVLACFFAAEEDGLIGSRELCRAPPVPKEALVAMLNLDMVGRGQDNEVVVLGTDENPALEKVLSRAERLERSGIRKVTTGVARELWERSDHYSFHEAGIPSLFLFEAPRETDNEDYHTFRDTVDGVSIEKVTNTARFAFNTTWLLADDDDRPPPPRR